MALPFLDRRKLKQGRPASGDRRAPSWLVRFERKLGLQSPIPARTLRVHILAVVATAQIGIILLANVSDHPENLVLFSAFCAYAAGILTLRSYHLRWSLIKS